MIALLAADAAAASGWQQWLPTILGAVVTTVGGGIFAVWVQRMRRRLDEASARAQDATADKSAAESHKARAETAQVVVATAHDLIVEIKAMMADQRTNYEAKIAEQAERSEKSLSDAMARHDEDMRRVLQRVTSVESREQQLRTNLRRHLPWDEQAVAILRKMDPGFPDPPVIDLD